MFLSDKPNLLRFNIYERNHGNVNEEYVHSVREMKFMNLLILHFWLGFGFYEFI